MSEYQYYEFQAIDRPLTEREIQELRAHSTRARITATSFTNEYHWGNFKGDPDRWMEKYFDAFIYFANWGTHTLMLSLPSTLLDLQAVKDYCGDGGLSVREKNRKIILTFNSEDEDPEYDEHEGNFGGLIQVRSELARGDLRALYLGWLLGVQNGEFDEDELEPSLPPGLGQLSAPLINLAEFLRLDPDLLSVAAQTSPPLQQVDLDPEIHASGADSTLVEVTDGASVSPVARIDYLEIKVPGLVSSRFSPVASRIAGGQAGPSVAGRGQAALTCDLACMIDRAWLAMEGPMYRWRTCWLRQSQR